MELLMASRSWYSYRYDKRMMESYNSRSCCSIS